MGQDEKNVYIHQKCLHHHTCNAIVASNFPISLRHIIHAFKLTIFENYYVPHVLFVDTHSLAKHLATGASHIHHSVMNEWFILTQNIQHKHVGKYKLKHETPRLAVFSLLAVNQV